MKQQRDGFVVRTYSRFPVQTSAMYVGQDFAGQGLVRELSRVGCRIFGNYPVTPGEPLSVRMFHPTQPDPLVIERAPVRWVKGLEFGVAFEHLDERQAARLQQMLDDLLGSRSYRAMVDPPR